MYCADCKSIVVESQGEVFKTCTCDAPIIAEMEATVVQHSSIDT